MILVSNVYHDHAFQASEQVRNYHRFFGDQAVQVVHLSGSAPATMEKEFLARTSELIHAQKVLINPVRLNTLPQTTLPQHIVNRDFGVDTMGENFSHIYIHTSGDLLVNGDPAPHIHTHDFGLTAVRLQKESPWVHTKKALSSPILQSISSEVYFGRAEGAFFPMTFFDRAIEIFHSYEGMDFFLTEGKSWPIEEALFATLFMAQDPVLQKTSNLIRTKELKTIEKGDYQKSKIKQSNMVTPQDLVNLVEKTKSQPVGIKWFSTDPHDKARDWLKSHLQLSGR